MKPRSVLATLVTLMSLIGTSPTWSQAARPQGPGSIPRSGPLRIERNLEYAVVGNRSLHLDLYLREAPDKKPLPIVVWVHDGASDADKSPSPAARLVANGYAVASVEYRLAGEAAFPAQLFDVKAAIRWLRANASQYNLDGAHIGAWGTAAGGQLVALLGTTGDVKELEGDEGHAEQSSRLQGVVDFYGPVDLMRTDPGPKSMPKAPALVEASLIGGTSLQSTDQVKAVNPISYITADDAPFLIVHGTADTLVSPRQSEFLQVALKHAGVDADLEYVPGANHSIEEVETPAIAEIVNTFFDKNLRGGEHQRDDIALIAEPPDSWIDPFTDDVPGTKYKLYNTPARGPNTRASYRIYLPPGYDLPQNARRRYPVIYYLAGFGSDSRSASAGEYVPRLDASIHQGLMPATIVVAVQSPNRVAYINSKNGRWPLESVIINDLIAHVDQTYRTVRERAGRAIEGHSMGGQGALRLGFKYPELFGTVASLSAALVTTKPGSSGISAESFLEQYSSDQDYFDAQQAGTWVEINADKIRGRTNIRLICGNKDDLLARSKVLSEAMTRLNIAHQLIESPNASHAVREVLARLDNNPFEFYGKAFEKFK